MRIEENPSMKKRDMIEGLELDSLSDRQFALLVSTGRAALFDHIALYVQEKAKFRPILSNYNA